MSDTETNARIAEVVQSAEVVLFMKGTPLFPQCGFSSRAIAILDHLGVEYATVDVLRDPEIRGGIKAFSDWPTIPQLYVKGEFVGGSDIMMEMYEAGELDQLLDDKGVARGGGVSNQAAGAAQVLSPLVRRVLAPNPSAFTYTGTQTYIVGHGEVAVIDPGPDLPEHVAAIIESLGDERVAAILTTHTHRDHSPAARELKSLTGAPIVGCAPLALVDLGPRADASFDSGHAPDRIMADGEDVSAPGWTLTAVATPGHTSNHLCFGLMEERALFTGDHVMGWSTTIVSPPDGDMAAYVASLGRIMTRDDTVYYPAHGEPVEHPQRFVRGLIGHRKQREGQILRLLGEAPATISAMVPRMYAGLDPGMHGAAGRSVLAHLVELEARGTVSRDGEAWRIAA